jgi:hypothetical protein
MEHLMLVEDVRKVPFPKLLDLHLIPLVNHVQQEVTLIKKVVLHAHCAFQELIPLLHKATLQVIVSNALQEPTLSLREQIHLALV